MRREQGPRPSRRGAGERLPGPSGTAAGLSLGRRIPSRSPIHPVPLQSPIHRNPPSVTTEPPRTRWVSREGGDRVRARRRTLEPLGRGELDERRRTARRPSAAPRPVRGSGHRPVGGDALLPGQSDGGPGSAGRGGRRAPGGHPGLRPGRGRSRRRARGRPRGGRSGDRRRVRRRPPGRHVAGDLPVRLPDDHPARARADRLGPAPRGRRRPGGLRRLRGGHDDGRRSRPARGAPRPGGTRTLLLHFVVHRCAGPGG